MIKVFITLTVILSFFYLQGQETSNNAQVLNLSSETLTDKDCPDLQCEPIVINRNNDSTSVFLLFPLGGTETGVSLFLLEDYLEFESKSIELHYKLKRHDVKVLTEGQPLTINMMGLADGEYIVEYMSCNHSRTLKFSLRTLN